MEEDAAAAEPDVEDAALLADAVAEPPAAEDVEMPAPIALAFSLPHTNDWQKVWPVRSFG